ncbi:spore germination protein [Gracilibacillus sp. S3-1-1]|uniref:Spore germination protein n=1 Tax=Gracilibacillus pellucidus TaxID=3095368 RepID=A0ACC6M6B6_9BACI|nr:spore germination protein [Gracilibacillus sp. S3-1-1]MDX8046448.1 spore germination protein [Gracilibacillus sp. S3-1-1]
MKNRRMKKTNKQVFTENISITYQQSIFADLKTNKEHLLNILGNSSDIIFRNLQLGKELTNAMIIFIDGLTDKETIQHYLLNPLMEITKKQQVPNNSSLYDFVEQTITTAELTEIPDFKLLLDHLLTGDAILFIDGATKALAVGSKGAKERNVEAPTTQQVVRGPKDSFTESIHANTALIRKRIKDPNLWFESFTYGTKTNTEVIIAYVQGIVNPDIVEEVKARLAQIDIDAILESGYIEELIQDETYTPFPTMLNSERPDAISVGLLEGRVAIIVDGTPFVLLVPALFTDFFKSTEDYYQRSDISSLIRLLRFIAFFLALLTPSTYIALTTFHQEMIPTTLLVSLAAQREGIPFPAIVEALIMEITFELLREAGIRLPNPIGSAISIVGALVLGQAAVDAGIVSATMVIVVSLTAISSFIIPNYNLAISVRILRFGFMLLAATLGLFGIFLGLLLLGLHLTSLRSFGIPYLSPLAPFITVDQQDTVIRVPIWKKSTRLRLINQRNIIREKTKQPQPPNKG